MVVQPRLSAAVMLLRDSMSEPSGMEVFMVRRVAQSEFMPDIYVFPGGSVSIDDQVAEQSEAVCRPIVSSLVDAEGRTALGTGVRAAAIRELFEEGNILLAYHQEKILAVGEDMVARFTAYRQAFHQRKGSLVELARSEQLVLATDRLVYFAHWITPEGMPKRFDTHFFLAAAPGEQEALYDQLETSEGRWLRPSQALADFERGEIPLVFATYHQLRELATFDSVHEALHAIAAGHVPTRRPIMVQDSKGPYVYLPEDPDNIWKV